MEKCFKIKVFKISFCVTNRAFSVCCDESDMQLQKPSLKSDNQINTIHKKVRITKLGNGRTALKVVTKIHYTRWQDPKPHQIQTQIHGTALWLSVDLGQEKGAQVQKCNFQNPRIAASQVHHMFLTLCSWDTLVWKHQTAKKQNC